MDENVLGALAAGEEAEAAGAVEPLDDDDLERADGACLRAGARRAGADRRMDASGSAIEITLNT